MEEMSDDLELEVLEPEAPEPDVLEQEVYLCEGAIEQSQGTLRELASTDPQRLHQF